jgi:Ethanolamine utilization protein EutJ (predicted chaperonin)
MSMVESVVNGFFVAIGVMESSGITSAEIVDDATTAGGRGDSGLIPIVVKIGGPTTGLEDSIEDKGEWK